MLLEINEEDNSIHTEDGYRMLLIEGVPKKIAKVFKDNVKVDYIDYGLVLEIIATYNILKTKPVLEREKFIKVCRNKRLRIKGKTRIKRKFNSINYSYSLLNNQGIISFLNKEALKRKHLLDKPKVKEGVLTNGGRTYLIDLIKKVVLKNSYKEIDSK